jgi:hypothetical protein
MNIIDNFEGVIVNNQPWTGRGRVHKADGTILEGEFRNGRLFTGMMYTPVPKSQVTNNK